MKNVKNIECNKVNLPKRGLGQKTQINRKAIIEHVKNGGDYNVPFVATFTDGSVYNGIFKIVKMFKEDGKKDIIIVEEDVLGQFGVLYDSFINGNFKGEFNSAWERMENNREFLRNELNRKNDEYIEQCSLHNYYKENYKATKNALTVAQNKITVLEGKIDEMANKNNIYNDASYLGNLPFIIKTAIKMYERGTSIDTIINKIAKKLSK